MIQVPEAIKLIEDSIAISPAKKVEMYDSLGYVLAKDIKAPINMPPFRQSAMDGYAFINNKINEYTVIDEIQAGGHKEIQINTGEAVRIFTGAFVPDLADTIVIQEHTTRKDNQLIIEKIPNKGSNIRPVGEQVKKGEIVLQKGEVINEATIGFLAGLGISKVKVYNIPKVCILTTGNELMKPGKKLEPGKIYESNSLMLKAALKKVGLNKVEIFRVKDALKKTKKIIKKCLKEFDIVLISGGISVGDYDYVKESLEDNKVEQVFYKINQKPGKPLFFGKKDNRVVFALPGNPASSLTCFYIYVLPALKKMMGHKHIHLTKNKVKVSKELLNTTGKSLFLKAMLEDGKIRVLDGQQSSMLKSFAMSNALIYIPHDKESVKKNEEVECYKL